MRQKSRCFSQRSQRGRATTEFLAPLGIFSGLCCQKFLFAKSSYQSPYDLVVDYGIGVFEVMNINSWSVIDQKVNPLLNNAVPIITDRSAVDNLAYFLTEQRTSQDKVVEPLVRAMAQHYASLVDRFVYFPVGVFPLVGDEMRKRDVEHQEVVDRNVIRALQELGISEKKIYRLRAETIEERVREIEQLIIV